MKYLIGTMLGWMLPVCFVSAAQAADIYVDARNGGKENGTITAPYRTIGAAVKAASSGDRIQIAAGNYAENLHLKKPLTLQGGFVGAQAQTYAAGGSGDFSRSEPSKQESVINGNAEAPVILAEGTIETTLDGLVLRGGKSGVESSAYPEDKARLTLRHCRVEQNGNPSVIGGGIRAKSELLVEDSIVRDNVGDRGSGIASGPARAIIARTAIQANTSHGDHGGGLYAAGPVDVVGCLVVDNTVGKTAGYGWGGGLMFFNEGTKATVTDTEVRGNFAPTKGSGVFVDDGAEASLRNVLIVNNRCAKEGGALYVDGATEQLGSKAWLTNVTIAGHDCGDNGYGNAVVMERASTLEVVSSIFWNNGPRDTSVQPGNTLTVRYSNTKDKLPGPGNLSADPLFASAQTGDYRLKNQAGRWDPSLNQCVKDDVTSPCVDKGDPDGSYEREPKPNGGRVDMGAFGNSPLAGCAPEQSLTTAAPGSNTPSLGPSRSGAAKGRCGCEAPGSRRGQWGWLGVALSWLAFRTRRKPFRR